MYLDEGVGLRMPVGRFEGGTLELWPLDHGTVPVHRQGRRIGVVFNLETKQTFEQRPAAKAKK